MGGGTDQTANGINQPRYTPYHIPHRTEVAGFMTILHGDDRFYNNIFIQNWPVQEVEAKEDMGFMMVENQEVGTAIFDEYPTYDEWIKQFRLDETAEKFFMMEVQDAHFSHLPVWVDGNAYFNGAKACKNEKSNFIDTENEAYVKLIEEDGKYRIETNKLGKQLMTEDEIAVMDGGKCILQLRGVRPFFSDKFDITKHPKYKYLSAADPKNAFDMEKHLKRRPAIVKPDEVFDYYELDAADLQEDADHEET